MRNETRPGLHDDRSLHGRPPHYRQPSAAMGPQGLPSAPSPPHEPQSGPPDQFWSWCTHLTNEPFDRLRLRSHRAAARRRRGQSFLRSTVTTQAPTDRPSAPRSPNNPLHRFKSWPFNYGARSSLPLLRCPGGSHLQAGPPCEWATAKVHFLIMASWPNTVSTTNPLGKVFEIKAHRPPPVGNIDWFSSPWWRPLMFDDCSWCAMMSPRWQQARPHRIIARNEQGTAGSSSYFGPTYSQGPPTVLSAMVLAYLNGCKPDRRLFRAARFQLECHRPPAPPCRASQESRPSPSKRSRTCKSDHCLSGYSPQLYVPREIPVTVTTSGFRKAPGAPIGVAFHALIEVLVVMGPRAIVNELAVGSKMMVVQG